MSRPGFIDFRHKLSINFKLLCILNSYFYVIIDTHVARSVNMTTVDLELIITEAAMKLQVKELREKQHEAVGAFLDGNDVFMSVPTGYGKSVVYGMLPYAFDMIRGMFYK